VHKYFEVGLCKSSHKGVKLGFWIYNAAEMIENTEEFTSAMGATLGAF
jgi:hypothetical protein